MRLLIHFSDLPVGERPPIQTYVQRVIGLGRRFPNAPVVAQVPSSLRVGGQRTVRQSLHYRRRDHLLLAQA